MFKNKRFNGLSLVVLLAVSAVACDPAKPILDREGIELKENTDKVEALLAPLAGRYEGMMEDLSRKARGERKKDPQRVRLVLVPTSIIVQNPGRNDITIYPTLGGTTSIILPALKEGEPDSVVPVAHYSMANYDAETGKLRLNGTYSTGSAGEVKVYLSGVFKDGHISAKAYSSLKGETGQLEVDRVQE